MVQLREPIGPHSSATDSLAMLCTVQNVDTDQMIADVTDQTGTSRKVSLKVMPGKMTDYPTAGERWVISRQYGDWMFMAAVGVPIAPKSTFNPSGWFLASTYGLSTSAVAATNDAAINNAINAASAAGGGIVFLGPGNFNWSAHIIVPNNVDLRGCGGGSTSSAGATNLVAQGAAAQIEFQGGGGVSGYIQLNGNSIATTPFKRGIGGQARSFQNLIAVHNAPAGAINDLALFVASQNDYFVQCGFGYADRDLCVFEQGYGGIMFDRCEFTGTIGRYWHRFDHQITGGPYPQPSNIKFTHCILEGGGTAAVSHIKAIAMQDVTYDKCWFFSTNGCLGPSIDVSAGVLRLCLVNPSFQSTGNTRITGTKAIAMTGNSTVSIVGHAWYFNFDTVHALDTVLPQLYDMSKAEFFNCNQTFVGTNGATSFQVSTWFNGIRSASGANGAAQEITYNANRTGIYTERLMDGTTLYYPGTGFTNFDVVTSRRATGVWGTQINTQQLLATGSGTNALRPTTTAAIKGAIYTNTDTKTIEWTDGTTWYSTNPPDFPSYITPYGQKNRYNSNTNWYNKKATNTRRIQFGLGRARALGQANVLVLSDSAGAGCNQAIVSPFTYDRHNAWPIAMAKTWARLGINIAGTGWIRCVDGPSASDARWSSTGTVANSSAFVTLNANAATLTCTLTSADFYSLSTYTTVEIWYRDDGTGTWTASVNGAASGTGFASVTNTNTGAWKKLVIPGVTVTSSSATLVITRSSSTVNLAFAAANFYTPGAGVVVHNLSQSGATASGTGFTAWADTSSTGLGGVYKDIGGHVRSVTDAVFTSSSATVTSATANFTNADIGQPLAHAASVEYFPDGTYIASVTNSTTAVMSQPAISSASGQILIIGHEPDAVIISLGGNDLPAATNSTVTAAFTTLKGLFTSSDVIYVAEHQKNDTLIPAATWESFVAALWAQADTDDVPLFDWRARVGNYTSALGNGLMGDNAAHMLVGAYDIWGSAIALGLRQ